MFRSDKISAINKILKEYFFKHKGEKIRAKEMMPEFVRAGIFESDIRGGLPIRHLLRELDAENRLYLIPYVLAERNFTNTNWFFTDMGLSDNIKGCQKPMSYPKEKLSEHKEAKRHVAQQSLKKKEKRDEHYVIDICDEILGMKAKRQHRFEFLKGDTGTKLPVDAYYEELNLVVEYRERQHLESVRFWNRPTASGIPRDEQRARYDQRRRDILPQHGIRLVEISFSDLPHNSRKRLIRNTVEDKEIIHKILKLI